MKESLYVESIEGMVEKLKIKKQILGTCLKMQIQNEEHTKSIMDEALESANESEQTQDLYDSYRTQLLQKREMFSHQLVKIIDERRVLERIDPNEIHTEVAFGSVVITDTQKLFISIGLGKFTCGGEDFFAISPMVPLFKVMEGKKAGESFTFNNREYHIKEVF